VTRYIFFVVVLASVGISWAKEPKTVQEALSLLEKGSADEVASAKDFLVAKSDLLVRYEKNISLLIEKTNTNSDLAPRILQVLSSKGDAGCKLIARFVTSRHRVWTSEVVSHYEMVPECELLKTAVGGILGWLKGPPLDSLDTALFNQVLQVLGQKKISRIPNVCRFLLGGSDETRNAMLKTIAEVTPEWSEPCLVQAYSDEAKKGNGSAALRHELLKTLFAVGSEDANPTLILALGHKEDFPVACELLGKQKGTGIFALVFALRTQEAKEEGTKRCLDQMGKHATSALLPLLAHPSEKVRGFVIGFIANFPSDEAFAEIAKRLDKREWRIGGSMLFDLLPAYPIDKVEPFLRSALAESEEDVRLGALSAIERMRAKKMEDVVLKLAEMDKSEDVRARAVEVAFHIGAKGLKELLTRQVQYESPKVAVASAFAIAFVGDSEALKALRSTLSKKALAPNVSEAFERAIWLLTYEDPSSPKSTNKGFPEKKEIKGGKEVRFEGGKANIFGKQKKPLLVVLPGGPGMDFVWLQDALSELASKYLVALLEPESSPIVEAQSFEALLSSLSRDKAVLLSLGLGGTNALALACDVPAKVAGVVAISAPLPSAIERFDDAIVANLNEPFATFARKVVETEHLFASDVLDMSLTRVLAPAMTKGAKEPWRALQVLWNVERYNTAVALLSRPQVHFSTADFSGRVAFILPRDALTDELWQGFEKLVREQPSRIKIFDVSGCGFLPMQSCEKAGVKTLKKALGFVSE
jgi:pimeloyl-ACP methyl ester carboxylesterase/HEAT repeat protein